MAMTQTEVVLMRKRRELDHALLALIAALAAAGFVMMGSASMDYAGEQYGNPFYHIIRHGIYLLLGAATMYLTLQIPVKLWQDAGPALLVSGMAIPSRAASGGWQSVPGDPDVQTHMKEEVPAAPVIAISEMQTLRPMGLVRAFVQQPASFWFACGYLFCEYVRPQSICRSHAGSPTGKSLRGFEG